jgi:hypothetical protein
MTSLKKLLTKPYLLYLGTSMLVPTAWLTFKAVNPQFDQVTLSNTSGTGNGILVVGGGSPPLVYKAYPSATDSILVGPVSLSASNNEVVAFNSQRAVAIQPKVPWTTGADAVKLPLAGPITIDVTVWVVRGSFAAQSNKAMAMKLAALSIWDQERMGVTFGAFDIQNQTGNPSAALFSNFNNCNMKPLLQADIGKTAGRINIYMVDLVWGSTGRGQACAIGSDFAVLASGADDPLLAHEIGHDFGLEHIDTVADFDETNVMHSASITRQYFSEGQLFRAHLAPLSALNKVYNARPGQPTRDCPTAVSSATCPPIDKRIWADGNAFPPN